MKSTFTPDLIKSLAESSRPQAEKNVQRNLALRALSETEGISISDQEIDMDADQKQDFFSRKL